MIRIGYRFALAAAVAIAASACESTNTSAPSTSSSSGTASVTAPLPTQPAANATVRFTDQPVTLAVTNAAVTKSDGTTYTFEVATDSAFAAKVQTKDNVAESISGKTSVTLDSLAASKDYYWRARATGGGTTGPFSAPARFTVGAAIIINAPAPVSPLNGTTASVRPAFVVANSTRSGPAGAISYLFEISTVSNFASITAAGTVAEGNGQTSFIPATNLPTGVAIFWRATAQDTANNVSSTPSTAQSITTRAFSAAETIAQQQLNQTLWTGIYPPGNTGHATMGGAGTFGVGWNVQTLVYAPENLRFVCPDLEMLRFFDLFDRGFDPDGAIGWMNSNGYFSQAQWYPPPEKAVLGLHTVYIAARGKVVNNATWDIVLRVE